MRPIITVLDDFCPQIGIVRQSALDSGFGKWTPNKGVVGSSVYEGMNYTGLHGYMVAALTSAMGQPILPNSLFFRVTNEETEKAYIHSDREMGAWTCIAYLSDHKEVSGTAFHRHRKTGWVEMPRIAELQRIGAMEKMSEEMVSGLDADWEQLDFVRGLYNRAVIFHAPLFHSRFPKGGISTDEKTGRMIWACHFHTASTIKDEVST